MRKVGRHSLVAQEGSTEASGLFCFVVVATQGRAGIFPCRCACHPFLPTHFRPGHGFHISICIGGRVVTSLITHGTEIKLSVGRDDLQTGFTPLQ